MHPTEITPPGPPPNEQRRRLPTRETVAIAALAGFMAGFGFVKITTDPPEPVPVVVDIGEPETVVVGREPASVTRQDIERTKQEAKIGKWASEGFDR